MNKIKKASTVSKAALIRVHLAEGLSVKDIAKRVGVTDAYVQQVRWHWKKGGKKAKAKKAKAKVKTEWKATEASFPITPPGEHPTARSLQRALVEALDELAIREKSKDRLNQKSVSVELDDLEEYETSSGDEWVKFFDEREVPPEPDMVNSPNHYTMGGIETIDFIEAKGLGYNLGNVVKYITRADHKGNREQDLNKALWYLCREIDKYKEW